MKEKKQKNFASFGSEQESRAVLSGTYHEVAELRTQDTESRRIKQLVELQRELFILESQAGNELLPGFGISSVGVNLPRIFELKTRIIELERQLDAPPIADQ